MHPGAEYFIKMRYIAEAAVEANGGNGFIGLDELSGSVVQAVLYDRIHEGFAGDLSEVAAEGVRGHAGDGGGLFQGDRSPEVVDEPGEDGVYPFSVSVGESCCDAAGVQEFDVFFQGQFMEYFQECDESAEVILFGGQCPDAWEDGRVGEVDPAMAALQEALDGVEFPG